MKQNKSIRIKAAILLTVFSLNIVIGFACSVGIDMGFNTHHHDEDAVTHHHDEELKTDKGQVSFVPVENCCNKAVSQLAQADKLIAQSFKLINPIFATAFLVSFYNIEVLYASLQIPSIKYFLQNYHPPITDIRIAIQSFQV